MVNSPTNLYNFGAKNVNVLEREQTELRELREQIKQREEQKQQEQQEQQQQKNKAKTRKKVRINSPFVKPTRRVKARRKAELNLLKLKNKLFLSPNNRKNLNDMTNVVYEKLKKENQIV